MTKSVEYRVRPVQRYVVTRYECETDSETDIGGASCTQAGEYASAEMAYSVGYALCRAEHERSGEPAGSMSYIYPDPVHAQ